MFASETLQPTRAKRRLLKETYQTFFRMVTESLPLARRARTRRQLQRENYENLRGEYGVASQLVLEAIFCVWNQRKTINDAMHKCVVRFDRRLFSFSKTKRGNPVVSLGMNHERIRLPISQDGAYQRLREHIEDGWIVTSIIMKRSLRFLAVLEKEVPEPSVRPNWMGIDINSSKIAVSIISKERVLKQTYFGQDVSTRQFMFEEHRAKLQGAQR